jgi:hypothetical protein
MDSYRIFVSYSHGDFELARSIVGVLKSNGLTPMWDKDFAWGHGFTEQIRNFISYSHVFVPLITKASSRRGWVHQEIGYATALNIPVLPVTTGSTPSGIIQQLLAVPLSDDRATRCEQLSVKVFSQLVRRAQKTSRPLFECAEYHEDRTAMMVEKATDVLELGYYGTVRQKGALSSFHIPDKPISHPAWQNRYGSPPEIDEPRCLKLREERQALERHARQAGCRLIIDPSLTYEKWGQVARKARLQELLEFLQKMPDDRVEIAIKEEMDPEHSLTIVGDWFAAESISAAIGRGYRQTIFTRHAPSVMRRIEFFDQELETAQATRWQAPRTSSRQAAIREMRSIISGL